MTQHTSKTILLFAAIAALSAPVLAAVSPEEAKQLGNNLTPWGAEKAGNKDGSIPAYTGGLTKPPASFKPNPGRYVVYPDPYAADKPLFRITGKNMAQYADKLSEGTKRLLEKNPDYFIDIMPTRRSVTYPDAVLKETLANATRCKTLKDEIALDEACRGGIPFPIPKTGYEVMWNKLVAYHEPETHVAESWAVDSTGRAVMSSRTRSRNEHDYYTPNRTDKNRYKQSFSRYESPPRSAGQVNGIADYLDPDAHPRKSWTYTVGQRRARLAPEFNYDTPLGSTGGAIFYDDLYLFSGKMDRFDFKLIGKKEMFIPYNSYKMYADCDAKKAATSKFVNPACDRWELHRVYVVEAKLKSGVRHAYSKRTYYIDEDTPHAAMVDTWDQGGALYRTGYIYSFQAYDRDFTHGVSYSMYDFNKNMYVVSSWTDNTGFQWSAPMAEKDLTPEAISGSSFR
jgi:hypothetical protein